MAQQVGQQGMRAPHARLHPLLPYSDPHRQRVDEQPHHPLGTRTALHASKQDRAEYHLLTPRYPRQHLRPSQVTQTRCAHPQLACPFSQPLG
jgi:hypothetical protein